MKALYTKFSNISIVLSLATSISLALFSDIFTKSSISICLFDVFNINLSQKWLFYLKICYFISLILFSIFIGFYFSNNPKIKKIYPKNTTNNLKSEKLELKIGKSLQNQNTVFIPEKGLYQNILITGTIGTGKTSSAMYPFLEQLLNRNIGMLILDVKGNFYKKVLELNQRFERKVIVIELNGKYKYNPLDKPNLKPSVIANRLKTILMLFSNQNTSDSYWLDKVELYLTECIKLCRLYNNDYVTFIELHKLINNKSYLDSKIEYVKKLFLSNQLSSKQIFDFNTSLDFFQNEFINLDSKVLSIIQSEVSRITQIFISDQDVATTFCPSKEEQNFNGFSLNSNEIVVLNMNVAEYRNLSKIIATYLKLDFQSEVLMRLSKQSNFSPLAFLCDEYHEYATENDADFYAQSREAKCINIVSTQSYTSLLKTIKDPQSAKVIIQNLVNKIWFRTDDNFTIEEAQKQLGKEDKTKFIRSIAENAKESNYNYFLKSFKSDKSSISESLSTQIYHDFIYDFNSFSRELKTFQAICFISTGTEVMHPEIVELEPIWKNTQQNNHNFI